MIAALRYLNLNFLIIFLYLFNVMAQLRKSYKHSGKPY